MINRIPGFMSQASARGARSTALHALQWVLGILLTALTAILFVGAPWWVPIALISAVGLVLLVFLGAFLFLLSKNPDALRSEEFSLSKMAMEKGLVGDTTYGFVDPKAISQTGNRGLVVSTDQGETQ